MSRTTVAAYEYQLRTTTCLRDFMAVCQDIVDTSEHVRINRKAVDAYAATLRVPDFIPDWKDYLTPRDKRIWSLTADFIELAANTSINAGYLYQDANGRTAKWEVGGSGAAALGARMDAVRNMGALPALDLKSPEAVYESLRPVFGDTPFAERRLSIWAELARPHVAAGLRDLLYSTRPAVRAKQHHFSFDHLRALGVLSPQGFGEDPFLKKAALLPILFAGVAHHKAGPGSVTMDPFCAADYRVPQTDHNIGLVRFSDALVARLNAEEMMAENDRMVMDVRASSWVITAQTLSARPDIQAHHLDGEKWFAGRLFDKAPGDLDPKKLKIRTSLESIGHESGFYARGFMQRATKPMAVASMRF